MSAPAVQEPPSASPAQIPRLWARCLRMSSAALAKHQAEVLLKVTEYLAAKHANEPDLPETDPH